MNSVCKDIFKAVHEGRWLSIEYRNKDGKVTKYWIGIKIIDPRNKRMIVDGLHLGELTVKKLTICIESIQASAIVEGTYCAVNEQLIEDIRLNPQKYRSLFDCVPNLRILNYLCDCNRLDTTPYKCDYALVQRLDADSFTNRDYYLDNVQFSEIVRNFQFRRTEQRKIRQLALNIFSVNCKQGLYVLAYRKLDFDVTGHTLHAADCITICKEFIIGGERLSVHQFLDAEDYDLLEDLETNLETVKDKITQGNRQIQGVDDMPYLLAIGMDISLDLNHEYAEIIEMYNNDTVTMPIKAFFGDFVKRPVRRKDYPLALLNRRVNLDQLLAIDHAMKYPLAYVQGPPGTGKTNTIVNTIMTAFFNERTVLFASYNNHPIDSVFEMMRKIKYKNHYVQFPMIRLGNNEKVLESLDFMKAIYENTHGLTIYDSSLDKNRDTKLKRTEQLTQLLKSYEEFLDLKERKEVVEHLLATNHQMNFQYELQGRQLAEINAKLSEIGIISDEDALKLLTGDTDEADKFMLYLYYISAKYIKRLDEPKNMDLLAIIRMNSSEDSDRIKAFNKYLSDDENVKKFLRIFPIVATTCISAHRIGEPKSYFDMVIMDEASQCNTAVSLVPILRGKSLMLVGDPQQLNPVILLDEKDNQILKKKYAISPEYDYIANSIYKTYLACDAISDEILLSYHYRCHRKIIEFNNKKYYNGKLNIKSTVQSEHPLVYVNVQDSATNVKNTSPGEVQQIISYLSANRDMKVGIITPFANQKKLINESLSEKGFTDVPCGTVHAFQGDEKDVILFSFGISDQTHQKTYDWLKNNKELINVATSRAREQLIILTNDKNVHRLHGKSETDDLYELIEYVKSNGISKVTERTALSRALGIKPYSSETESAFLDNLNHALSNILPSGNRYTVHKEVSVSQVFQENTTFDDLFYTGRFDFVVYERVISRTEVPVLAIELDGKEHIEDEAVRRRDQQKNEICRQHGFELIRVENSYSRRYHYIKDILIGYFSKQ
jgi:DNA-directed RNA polymerase subunit L